jgi:hypothetical protein
MIYLCVIYEDKPLNDDKLANVFISPFDEDKGNLGHKVMDTTFQIFYHSRDMDCLENYGNPIYDTCSDVFDEKLQILSLWVSLT